MHDCQIQEDRIPNRQP